MNATETKQAVAVMTAWAEGNKIQCRRNGAGAWVDIPANYEPACNWQEYFYRIDPEPEPSMLVGPFTQPEAGTLSVTFANQHAAIEQLCLKVFGAKPTYKDETPPPTPAIQK